MKIFKQILFLCFLAVLTGCSEDAIVSQSEELINAENGSVDLISMVVPDIEMDATTRSKLIDDGSQLKFEWKENDEIGVVPMSGRPLSFPIHAENAGKNTALFDGGGWALKSSEKYAAFFPIEGKNQKTDISHIIIDYTGQTLGNYTNYDFLATGAVKPSNGQVTFNMKRLSAILKITISMPAGSTARYGTLIAPTPVFGVMGTLDLSGSEPVYTPEGLKKFINTDIGGDRTSASAWNYTVYMMIPPTDLSGETLTFRLTSEYGSVYEATLTGKNFEAGKAYQLSGTATGAVIKNANLIAAAENAEDNPGVGTFIKNTDNTVNVNDNLDKILSVVKINVASKNDPSVCDEIGYFKNLKTLLCQSNKLTSLDVLYNTAMTYLHCGNNQLTSLDVSNNTALKELYCYSNQLTSLDVSNNLLLKGLYCSYNQLTTLDVSNNTALTNLVCFFNKLTLLDVSNNTALIQLDCGNNQLTSLDVSNNTALIQLTCGTNQLTSLDVSNNTALKNLYCVTNQLTSLDVSNNTALERLYCNDNQLTSLDVSNNKVLTYLYCGFNQLTSLDVSNNTALIQLACYSNQLSSLNVSNNTKLQELYCGSNNFVDFTIDTGTNGLNKLKTLSIENCAKLEVLNCYPSDFKNGDNGSLTTLNVSGCTKLDVLNCLCNLLTSLDVSSNTALHWGVSCHNNLLKTLDVTRNTNLNLGNIVCGSQWTDANKTTPQPMTLYISSSNTGTFNTSSVYNSGVTIETP